MANVRIGLAQVGSTADKAENLEKARQYIREAARLGVELIVFPEVFMSHFPPDTEPEVLAADREPVTGPFAEAMNQLLREFGLWGVYGMRELAPGEAVRAFNTTLMVDTSGNLVARYRKTHLYDAFGAQESRRIVPGDHLFEPVDTPFGRIGLFVCYELRFPEVAREQVAQGADLLVVPSGWVRGPLKEFHWQTLVTARALENTVFVAAADQVSDYYCGQSLVVDPMGVALVTGTEAEQLLVTDIVSERLTTVRAKLPSYRHRRPELYRSARDLSIPPAIGGDE